MERDDYADMFRFPLGQCVCWSEYPYERHYVTQRRWTQRQAGDAFVEYRLALSVTGRGSGYLGWVREEDVRVWEEPPSSEKASDAPKF